jgi:hypothetical protein
MAAMKARIPVAAAADQPDQQRALSVGPCICLGPLHGPPSLGAGRAASAATKQHHEGTNTMTVTEAAAARPTGFAGLNDWGLTDYCLEDAHAALTARRIDYPSEARLTLIARGIASAMRAVSIEDDRARAGRASDAGDAELLALARRVVEAFDDRLARQEGDVCMAAEGLMVDAAGLSEEDRIAFITGLWPSAECVEMEDGFLIWRDDHGQVMPNTTPNIYIVHALDYVREQMMDWLQERATEARDEGDHDRAAALAAGRQRAAVCQWPEPA